MLDVQICMYAVCTWQPEMNYKKVRGADATFDGQKPYLLDMRPPPFLGNF
jgi:hypothetical protein